MGVCASWLFLVLMTEGGTVQVYKRFVVHVSTLIVGLSTVTMDLRVSFIVFATLSVHTVCGLSAHELSAFDSRVQVCI